jgi:phosphinothricin acetyltransferase
MTPAHWSAVRRIYEAGIATGNATFETEAPDWHSWDSGHLHSCRFVAVAGDDHVIGWAALRPVSPRPVYAGVCEVSVYIAPEAQRQGVGSQLLEAIIACSEDDGRWTLQAGIFPENEGSVALHVRAGFRVIGRRERLAVLNGRWRDVLLLERRSSRVGTVDPSRQPGA